MRIYLTLIIFILFSRNAFGQTPIDSGFTNKAEAKNLMVNGLREGKWVEYRGDYVDSIDTLTAYWLTVYKKGKYYGINRGYYKSGKMHIEASVKNDIADGTWKEYYENGKLKQEILFWHGLVHGIWKQYYENGNIEEESAYLSDSIDGKENGINKEYYENGTLKLETSIKNGELNGLEKGYYRDGKIMYQTPFKDGNPGTRIWFDPEGNMTNKLFDEYGNESK